MKRVAALATALVVLSACAKGTPTNPILGPGESPTPLQQPQYVGIGKFQELGAVTMRPTFGGVPYVSFVEVHEPAGGSEGHRDVPGFVYAYQGSPVLSQETGETLRQDAIPQGSARWADTRSQYSNTSPGEDVWYFVGLRSITQRSAPLPYTNAKTLYASGDLPQPPSDKQLVFILGYITMDVDGRTSAHSHGGTEVFYVIKGTVALATNDGQRLNLSGGQGASIKPGVVMQLRVVGPEPVQILTLFVTPEGAPWQTNVQTLP